MSLRGEFYRQIIKHEKFNPAIDRVAFEPPTGAQHTR